MMAITKGGMWRAGLLTLLLLLPVADAQNLDADPTAEPVTLSVRNLDIKEVLAMLVQSRDLNLVYEGTQVGSDITVCPNCLRNSVNPAVNVNAVDRDLSTPYQDEFRVFYERELWTETLLHVEYINRKYRDQFQNIDLNHVPGVRREDEGRYVRGLADEKAELRHPFCRVDSRRTALDQDLIVLFREDAHFPSREKAMSTISVKGVFLSKTRILNPSSTIFRISLRASSSFGPPRRTQISTFSGISPRFLTFRSRV